MGGERPIVYLNRLPGVLATKPDTTPVVEPETASSEAAPEAPTKPLSEIWRSEIVEVEDTGEQVTLSENAETLGGRLAKRISNMEKLMECLKS
jgi:hypothetical protein